MGKQSKIRFATNMKRSSEKQGAWNEKQLRSSDERATLSDKQENIRATNKKYPSDKQRTSKKKKKYNVTCRHTRSTKTTCIATINKGHTETATAQLRVTNKPFNSR